MRGTRSTSSSPVRPGARPSLWGSDAMVPPVAMTSMFFKSARLPSFCRVQVSDNP